MTTRSRHLPNWGFSRTRLSAKRTPFQSALLAWYQANKRSLDWRRSTDPYLVWVSEIMLQQTTVKSVQPYFRSWTARFPTVEDLAAASVDEVLEQWAGLGYYSRGRRLLEGAQLVVKDGWPTSAREWERIPGVGKYTACAIASISLNEPVATVDGNIERVFARIQADASSGQELKKRAWSWADSQLETESPGDWNQALMELGATICTPRNPLCDQCPVREFCQAQLLETVADFPVKAPGPQWRPLEHVIVVPRCGGLYGVRKSPENEWWAGMWGFPRGKSRCELAQFHDSPNLILIGSFSHVVTKHKISVEVVLADCMTMADELNWFPEEAISSLGLPAPQRRAWNLALDWIRRSDRQPTLVDS